MCDDFPEREVVTTRDSSQLSPSVTMQGQYSTPGPVTSAPERGGRGPGNQGGESRGNINKNTIDSSPCMTHDARTDKSDFLDFSRERIVFCNCPSNLFTFYKT